MGNLAENATFQMIEAGTLRTLMDDVFGALHVPADEIRMVVDALMEATLSGYNSHGVMRIPRYVEELQRGNIIAGAEFKILKETASSAYVDAGRALGPVTATLAVNLACEKAADTGIGCVSTKNSNDIGRLGSYVLKPAKSGFLTLIMVNDSGGLPSVAPFGGAKRFFSTNPFGAGIPTEHESIVIDISTSMTSVGKLRMAANRSMSVPNGWLIDSQGKSVVNASKFFQDPNNVVLLPLGGLLAGHKGFALQLLIDVLAGGIGGAGVCTGRDPGIEANAIFTIAIDPEHFASHDTFIELVSSMVAGLKNVNTLPNVDEIMLPGERAARERQIRHKYGIPLDSVTCRELELVLVGLGLVDKYKGDLYLVR